MEDLSGRKMITVYVDTSLFKEFKVRTERVNLDMSKVIRQLIARYLAQSQAEEGKSAMQIRRDELTDHIMANLAVFAASRRNDAPFLAVMEDLLGFDRGTLIALTQDKS